MGRMLTYRQAIVAARIGKTTIKRWRRLGMPMSTDEKGRRVVDEDVLFQWKRDMIRANPVRRRPGATQSVGVSDLTPRRWTPSE